MRSDVKGATTVITLDHTAVREIINNDPEFAIEIRQAVLQSACKNTIKKVVSGDFDDRVRVFIKDLVTKEFGKFTGHGYNHKFTPSEKFNKQIGIAVRKQFRQDFIEGINVHTRAVSDDLKSYCEDRVKEILNQAQQAVIEQTVSDILTALSQAIFDKVVATKSPGKKKEE